MRAAAVVLALVLGVTLPVGTSACAFLLVAGAVALAPRRASR